MSSLLPLIKTEAFNVNSFFDKINEHLLIIIKGFAIPINCPGLIQPLLILESSVINRFSPDNLIGAPFSLLSNCWLVGVTGT